jgi:hypothetical protein
MTTQPMTAVDEAKHDEALAMAQEWLHYCAHARDDIPPFMPLCDQVGEISDYFATALLAADQRMREMALVVSRAQHLLNWARQTPEEERDEPKYCAHDIDDHIGEAIDAMTAARGVGRGMR